MGEQQSTSRLSVLLSALAVVVAAAAFGGAFYYFDGLSLVRGVFAATSAVDTGDPSGGSREESRAAAPKLGEDIPEEFALRLWQEQVDSQPMIQRLVDGDIEAMRITRVESSSAEATLGVEVVLSDEVEAEGVIGLKRFGDFWYVSFASLERDGRVARPRGPLPSRNEVDIALLNTIFDQQYGAAGVVAEYLDGTVKAVAFEEPQRGPSTVTLDVEMNETHGEGYAQLVAVEREVDGRRLWFIVRFTKTGHDPAYL